jgi:hypothetical protein
VLVIFIGRVVGLGQAAHREMAPTS